ncbi:MAG: oligosaccharide flippase family protein [Bacteroidales bacterium]|jgi:O-antigen/teichoic acid export membrane protein|nr:oligosaccharide flippase family protein [Bacteroidales bacterium]
MPPINKSRIAKNTALLYFRMLLIMLITLYITRVLLNVLGKSDYGTYEVVGTIVAMFTFLGSTMATAAQRFFAVELGIENYAKLKQLFSVNVLVFIGLAIVILILAETVGLWYLNNIMNIPADRIIATAWVYQFSVFSAVTGIVTIPYVAIITAREHMKAYAYLSILEVLFKLAIVFALLYFSLDKLILYALLAFLVQILISATYIVYSTVKFPECKLKYYWNKTMFKDVLNFAGWNVIGSLSMTFRSKGIDLLLNSFFDVLVNAARGLAYRVYNALILFITNFFTAIRPQIIKSYSADNDDSSGELMKLVFQSSKFCYYLILILSIPVLIETSSILNIWLNNNVPEYTVVFTRLIIIVAIIESLANPLVASINATGIIKKYQIVTSTIILMILPVSYLFLKFGFPPQVTMYISIVASVLAQICRVYYMNKLLKMNTSQYIKQVILPISAVTVPAFVLPAIFYISFDESFMRLVGVCTVTVISSGFSIFYVGLTKSERKGLVNIILRIVNKGGL